jgi:hypothetical protein
VSAGRAVLVEEFPSGVVKDRLKIILRIRPAIAGGVGSAAGNPAHMPGVSCTSPLFVRRVGVSCRNGGASRPTRRPAQGWSGSNCNTQPTDVATGHRRLQEIVEKNGDPGRIRTSDLQLRRLLLYPLSYGAVPGRAFNKGTGPSLACELMFPATTSTRLDDHL